MDEVRACQVQVIATTRLSRLSYPLNYLDFFADSFEPDGESVSLRLLGRSAAVVITVEV